MAAGRRQLSGDTRDFAYGFVWPSSAGIGLAELRKTMAAVPRGDDARRRDSAMWLRLSRWNVRCCPNKLGISSSAASFYWAFSLSLGVLVGLNPRGSQVDRRNEGGTLGHMC
ncbi:hypothetical protein Droror1_Dr00020325 [Drosera rotundifolia]